LVKSRGKLESVPKASDARTRFELTTAALLDMSSRFFVGTW